MVLLTVKSVSKEFDDLLAVDDASFNITDGEFVSILGPSGSGKSTILRMIAGFEKPTNGEICIKKQSIVNKPPFQRDTNMVFQGLALFPHLTVSENIAYGLKNKGVSTNERKDRIKNMLEMVQLSGYGDRNPEQLSGGEQQRVALARALVGEPSIVLFDEPLASLDRKLRQHMQIELQRIQSEMEITFLYVTHNQEVAMSVSDRLILLNDGEIEQIGTAKNLYEDPVSRFVADFIGDVNTIPCSVHDVNDDGLTVKINETELAFSIETTLGDRNSEQMVNNSVSICVRPPYITLSDNKSAFEFAISGRVRNRIYRGNEISYVINTSVGTLTANTDTEQFQIGDTVYATWPKAGAGIHVFFDGEKEDLKSDEMQNAIDIIS